MNYLESVAYKTLFQHFDTFVYIDGFSGPWKSKDENYKDTSFGIALRKLEEVRKNLKFQHGRKTKIKCVFVEKTKSAFNDLKEECAKIRTIDVLPIHGKFEESLDQILSFIGPTKNTFVFTFVDPTGWTVDLAQLEPLLSRQPGEVLFNFMFDHINRFNEKFPESFIKIFADENWQDSLDTSLHPSVAVPKLFSQRLKKVGNFKYVAATEVLKESADRTHFHLFYGTRHLKGLEVFRDIQRKAGKEQDHHRTKLKKQNHINKTGEQELFPLETPFSDSHSLSLNEEHFKEAQNFFASLINLRFKIEYDNLLPLLLERFVVTKKDVNDILRHAIKTKQISFIGLNSNERIPKVRKGHLITLTNPPYRS